MSSNSDGDSDSYLSSHSDLSLSDDENEITDNAQALLPPPLSAYEKIREGNIKRNNAKLLELNFATFVKTARKRKAKVAKQPVTTENNDNTEAFDAEKQTINTNVKIPPVRKAKVAKLPVATDNNGSSSGSSSDDSDPQVPKLSTTH